MGWRGNRGGAGLDKMGAEPWSWSWSQPAAGPDTTGSRAVPAASPGGCWPRHRQPSFFLRLCTPRVSLGLVRPCAGRDMGQSIGSWRRGTAQRAPGAAALQTLPLPGRGRLCSAPSAAATQHRAPVMGGRNGDRTPETSPFSPEGWARARIWLNPLRSRSSSSSDTDQLQQPQAGDGPQQRPLPPPRCPSQPWPPGTSPGSGWAAGTGTKGPPQGLVSGHRGTLPGQVQALALRC